MYAGQARLLSARAATPQLVTLAERGGSLLDDAPPPCRRPTNPSSPASRAAWAGCHKPWRTPSCSPSAPTPPSASSGAPGRPGFELVVGETRNPETITADAVVLATPAAPTARLLQQVAPPAAAPLAEIDYASMAVVTLAFRADEVGEHLFDSSGFLVPPVEGRRIKASTFSFAKWDWVREAGRDVADGEEVVVLRTSLGRYGEELALQVPDDELVASSLADLADATGLRARLVDSHVQRWGGGLPQYAVGHLDRVARIRAAVAEVPGLAICGAAYDGVGIPAVIASARRAAVQVVAAEA